jgi:mono/diheme cytochrome c family protein
MTPRPAFLLTCCASVFLAGAALAAAGSRSPSALKPQGLNAAKLEYNRDIRPILSDKCFACHGPDASQRKAGLRLDTADGALSARGGRRAIVPGKPEQSELIRRVMLTNALQMPPASTGKKLSPREIELLKRWVAQGGEYQAHWAYIAPREVSPPPARDAAWVRNPIDRFLLSKIEAAGLKPAPEADPVTLIRRLSFDLTGIPPTPAEVDAFAADTSPTAYEKVVDRLLASPRYGERMAMYWLDLVRYADTVGYHGDQEHAISPYRDYVIKSFNENLPFDRFTAEQLAGDLLPNPTLNQRIATGYNRLLQTTHEGGAQDKEYRAKYAADRVRNLSGAWLGATVGCAECHDHKYDPYTQKDFYSLAAFFADMEERGAYGGPDATPTLRPPEIEVLSPFDQEEAERLAHQIREVTGRMRRAEGDAAAACREELGTLQQRLDEVQKRKRRTMVTVAGEPRPVRVLARGDWMDESGPLVQAAVPGFLPGPRVKDRRLTRLDLARWLTAPENPLTARVFANRVWYLLFGSGLCRSLEDFGAQGEPPTHPELLDHLAIRFARGGVGIPAWDVKALIRYIVTSSAYRQTSTEGPTPNSALRTPHSKELFARQGRFRLPAEMIRDQALFASGLLVERLGGPSARPYQPEGYYALLNFPKRTYESDRDEGQWRRGVYVHWQRQFLHPMLRAFDAPSREECTAKRPVTNTPLAALTLLNDPSFIEAARVLAARMLKEGGADDASRLRWGWRQVLSREPNEREVAALRRLCESSRSRYREDRAAAKQLLSTGLVPVPKDLDEAELAAWTAVGRALLNLSETITRS